MTARMPEMALERHRNRYRLPSVLMRSGTSRGLFLHRRDLPPSTEDWAPILISAMGSRNNDPRQLEGVGGATSTTSKVIVVSKSDKPDVDVEYTFVQVSVGLEKVDMTGNCGNMASGVAAFALDEGLVKAEPGQCDISVRIYNTNTNSYLIETIEVDSDGLFQEDGDYHISGVKSGGSCIKVAFLNPGGSMTGKVFPTGNRQDSFTVQSTNPPDPFTVRATLIDVSNPFIFVDSATMPSIYHSAGPDADISLEIIEAIRRQGAVHFGLAPDPETAGLRKGTPKIALLSSAQHPPATLPESKDSIPDISVLSYSMGKVHPSFQLTGAVCLGAAACLCGTVAADLWTKQSQYTPPESPERELEEESELVSNKSEGSRKVVLAHRSGLMEVEVDIAEDDLVRSVTAYRTARRVFEGTILATV